MTEASAGAIEPPKVQNGTYTVSHRERGHFVLKLFTGTRGDFAGKRMLALLNGPDNVNDYRAVAFWVEKPEPLALCWKRFLGVRTIPIDGFHWTSDTRDEDGVGLSAIQKKLCIWADLAIRGATDERHGFWYCEGYQLEHAGVCVVCNRKLTDPESIRLGIGPKCGGRS